MFACTEDIHIDDADAGSCCDGRARIALTPRPTGQKRHNSMNEVIEAILPYKASFGTAFCPAVTPVLLREEIVSSKPGIAVCVGRRAQRRAERAEFCSACGTYPWFRATSSSPCTCFALLPAFSSAGQDFAMKRGECSEGRECFVLAARSRRSSTEWRRRRARPICEMQVPMDDKYSTRLTGAGMVAARREPEVKSDHQKLSDTTLIISRQALSELFLRPRIAKFIVN